MQDFIEDVVFFVGCFVIGISVAIIISEFSGMTDYLISLI